MNIGQSQSNIQAHTNPVTILTQLIEILNQKEKAVIIRRFGLQNNGIETLAAIGNDFSVTRERIRQIQAYSIKKLQRSANKTNLTTLIEWAQILLKEHGDIIAETTFENQLQTKFPEHQQQIQELKLATILFDDITFETNKIHFRPHFRKREVKLKNIKTICSTARTLLKDRGDSTSQNQLISKVQDILKSQDMNVRKKLILAAIKLDRRMTVKSDSVSITNWRHVNPKTLYDKILFILHKTKAPLHFTDITNKIIEGKFDAKSVSQQAVHNELINKTDFILVGRGIYALEEWGYKKGTVTDVIKDILSEKGPQSSEDLIQEVLQRRKVKQITVQININNKELFTKTDNIISLLQ